MWVEFNEIKARREVTGKCVDCGKRRKRVIVNCQTINPFNKNEEGFVKTANEIRLEVDKAIAVKQQDLKSKLCAHPVRK